MAIQTVTKGAIEYLVAEGISTVHCFTTRLGGVSKGYLASMNLGLHRGDNPENVRQNYKILTTALGIQPEDLVLTKQIHSDIIRRVGRADQGLYMTEGATPECDGLITNEPGTALVVFGADCTPILLWDSETGAVGACHAGWRGTAMSIAGKTAQAMVREFGCKPENLHAAIGPNISACCFETTDDVPNAMLEAFGEDAKAHITPKGDKFYVNLKGLNALSLEKAGVRHIEIATQCTACDPTRFWSHRRMGDSRGAQGAIIFCKEVR